MDLETMSTLKMFSFASSSWLFLTATHDTVLVFKQLEMIRFNTYLSLLYIDVYIMCTLVHLENNIHIVYTWDRSMHYCTSRRERKKHLDSFLIFFLQFTFFLKSFWSHLFKLINNFYIHIMTCLRFPELSVMNLISHETWISFKNNSDSLK